MRYALLALALVAGCRSVDGWRVKGTPREQESVYVVVGMFVALSAAAAIIVLAGGDENASIEQHPVDPPVSPP